MSTSNVGHQTYSFGEFTLDVDRGALTSAGIDVKLRPKAFEVLCYLVKRHGRLVSKDELLEAIWGQTVVTDDAVTQCLIDIRKAIKDSDQEKIRTVPRRGYILELPVIANGATDGASGVSFDSITNLGRRWQYAAMLVALLAAALWWGLSTVGDRAPTVHGTVSGTESPSIAVLPFQDMSPNQDHEYFADGMAEEILNLLTRVPELKVIARTSSFSFKGKGSDINEIAERLRVTHILEGSVRKSNDSIRVTAQLVDASTGVHLWSDTYDRTLNDVLAIQDEISAEVVEQLRVNINSLAPATQQSDPEAYRLYLLAVHQLAKMDFDLNTQAESLLRQALQIDPNLGPAWRELSRVLWRQVGTGPSSHEDVESTRNALKRALDIDSTDPAALAYGAWQIVDFDGDVSRAARLFERAISIGPANEHVGRAATLFALAFGQPEDAIALGEYSIARNPLCFQCHYHLAIAYRNAGKLDKAESAIRTTHSLFGGGLIELGNILLLKRQPQAALESFGDLPDGRDRLVGTTMAMYDLGYPSESAAELAEAELNNSPWQKAQLYAWTGQIDVAFAAINSLFASPGIKYDRIWIARNLRNPMLKNLHDDPRWQPLLEQNDISEEQLADIRFSVTLPE